MRGDREGEGDWVKEAKVAKAKAKRGDDESEGRQEKEEERGGTKRSSRQPAAQTPAPARLGEWRMQKPSRETTHTPRVTSSRLEADRGGLRRQSPTEMEAQHRVPVTPGKNEKRTAARTMPSPFPNTGLGPRIEPIHKNIITFRAFT